MFRKRPTPNCAICKWVVEGIISPSCGAQGGSTTILSHGTRKCKKLFEEKKKLFEDVYKQGIIGALEIASEYSQYDGAHHKTWVIDQMVRKLLINISGYNDFIKKCKDGEDGPNTYDWDEGIAP